jgi:hypothetical protein
LLVTALSTTFATTSAEEPVSNICSKLVATFCVKDKPIPKSYPQLQGKVEAYNKIVKNEFLAVEDISSIDDGKLRY